MSYPLIEQATGVHNVTAMRWCGEAFSPSANEEAENPLKVQGADKKEYPAERPSPEDLAERRRRVRQLRELVIRLRKEHRLSYRQIEEATGVPKSTVTDWCGEADTISGVRNRTPENSVEAVGADGKAYPSERLSPEDP